jgi:hypothetical protein
MKEAAKELREALQIHRELAKKDVQAYLPAVAETLNDLGVLDRDWNGMEQATKDWARRSRFAGSWRRKTQKLTGQM